MKKIIIIWEADNFNIERSLVRAAQEAGESLGMEVVLFPKQRSGGPDFYEYLKKEDADYLLSFDMAGFEKSTLQESSAYNILYAKQIHVLLKNDSKYRKFLGREQALNLFFFAAGEREVRKYREEYPHLLNLEEMPELAVSSQITEEKQRHNKEALQQIIEKVKKEAETAGVH